MQEQMSNAMQQFHKLLEPSRRMNALLLDHAEKVAHLTLEAARSYTTLAMEQWRKALEIRDPESLQSYLTDQGKVMQTVSNRVSEDVSTLADISKNMGEEVQKIAQENVSVISETVQQGQPAGGAKKASGSGSAAASSGSGSASSSAGSSSKKSA